MAPFDALNIARTSPDRGEGCLPVLDERRAAVRELLGKRYADLRCHKSRTPGCYFDPASA
jgi:hypothetical protein